MARQVAAAVLNPDGVGRDFGGEQMGGGIHADNV
jgi:hypothetical protein